jgi:TRAP-type C4-dicarboxylate transport system permease small subunit
MKFSEKGFWKFFGKLTDAMAALAGAILVFICAAVCYTIGLRFLFTKTTIWIIPITEYALLWIVFLGTPWLLREKGHITTDILYTHLNKKAKRTLDYVMFMIGGLACAMMAYFGIVHIWDCVLNRVTDVRAITIPKSGVFIIIPIGSLLLTLQFSRMAWSRFIDMKSGN